MMRFLTFLLLLSVSAAAQDPKPDPNEQKQPTFRVDVKLVDVFTTVNDESGAPITDLKREEFRITEDGVEQKIALFEQQSETPLSIVMCIDASQSVGKDLQIEAEAARKFAASILRPVDKLALYQFSEIVREIVPFTSDIKRINRGIKKVRLGSGTALYDAIYLGGQMLAKREGRKILVVITDGGDTMSSVDYHEAVRAAQHSDALVYSIIDVPIAASAGRNTGGEHALIQLSKDTGGKHYYADTAASMDKVFQQISKELRTQYLLGYYPVRRLASSDFRKIEVKVERSVPAHPPAAGGETGTAEPAVSPAGRLRVRHRNGYYTSKLE
ncbi:MAG: VWA domain-containing protein [Terriglobales bacterium]